ncbi:PAS domain-containing protein [bacterium]|nr:PAS domain-containing protein [bacterium]
MTKRRLLGSVFRSYLLAILISIVAAEIFLHVLPGVSGMAATVVLGVALAYFMAWRFVRLLEEIRRGAERFGRGDLSRRVPDSPIDDLSALAQSLNHMASQLDERIAEITRQRNEREAILASMGEGVLAIDRNERVLNLNRAAEEMLGRPVEEARGRLVQEAFRNVELQRYIARALHGEKVTADETAMLTGVSGVLLQIHAAPLLDSTGREAGLVLILANVTRLHRLENLRREFVANVSHELRTPVTSIKGFAETLLDGALDEPDDARRFVEILARQAQRLDHLIEDLLMISRLERREEIEMGACRLRSVLESAIDVCAPRAESRKTAINVDCAETISITCNRRLLEQAVVNLVDNAVAYSGEEACVDVSGESNGGTLTIRVADNGPGIPPEHHERLFERFYRVDKARSRDAGGTGLGLSIVKHIAQLHGGTVSIESTLGEGTTFTIQLPESPN